MCRVHARCKRAHGKPTVQSKQTMTPEPYVTADDIAKHLKITRPQALENDSEADHPGSSAGNGRASEGLALQD